MSSEVYKRKIIALLDKIENVDTLAKILAIVKTHYEILKERRGD